MEHLRRLFQNMGDMLRNVFSGFVALAVAWVADETHTVLKDLYAFTGPEGDRSWLPILFLGVLLGICIYSAHLAFYSWTFNLVTFKLARYFDKSGGKPRCFEHLHQIDDRRWERGYSEDKKAQSKQASLDSWSAQVHFRYTSAFAIGLTPFVMRWLERDVPHAWPFVLTAIAVFLVNLIDDCRLQYRYIKAE